MDETMKKMTRVVLLLVLVFFSIYGMQTVSKYIGYASFSGAGGNIYNLVIEHRIKITEWSGMYGVGVRVDGYDFPQSKVFVGGEVVSNNLLFDCLEPDITHEIYASVWETTAMSLNTIYPATLSDINDMYGFNGSEYDSADKTFTANITFRFGSQTITAPGAYTYKIDETGVPATFGMVALKDANGKIFFGAILTNFTPGYNGEVINYQMLLPVLQNQSNTRYYFFTDPSDTCPAGQGENPLEGGLIGNVTDQGGIMLQDVIVSVADRNTISDAVGFYNMSVQEGIFSIFGVKSGYVTYVNNVTIVYNETTVHNIVMIEIVPPNPNTDVGPGQTNNPNTDVGPGLDSGPGQDAGPDQAPPVPFVEQPKQIEGTDYIISLSDLKRKIRVDNFIQESIYIYSFKKSTITTTFTLEGDGNLSNILILDKDKLVIEPNSNAYMIFTIYGRPPIGTYYGNLTIGGDLNATIPVEIEVLPKDKLPVEALLMNLETNEKSVLPGKNMKFKTDLRNLLIDQAYPVQLLFTIQPADGNSTVWSYQTNVYLNTAFSLIRNVDLPKDLEPGDYLLRANARYLGLASSTSTIFRVEVPFWNRMAFGLRYWMWVLILIAIAGFAVAGYLIRNNIEGKKKYHLKVDDAEMPKPGPRNIYVGKIAETDKKTYMNLENFKTHTIIAGSTGGGKSVSAQVIIEEALEHDIAVICFDPTAQWTGMLRPCKDKTMLALFPFFGMKATDARAFNGNIRMITNAREIVDIKKYVKPGEIQVFACHKLDPRDMDIVVANAIREIFHSNFNESKPLKVFFVFDEVHRLLPKFGGSGDGFLQIERGCREFRKWGLGIMLISQVLSDFVGTIKANINTEIQMRTRDEGDLDRIKQRYGEEVLRSLVKATVGTGLVENPAYNRGKPYFAAFKPLRHSVERLPDDEIEEYNKYNEIIDDIEFSLQQLDEAGIDVFDLKLELKLALDKVKSGNFNMVKIYLEGLTPRINKQWEKLGRKPKKYEKRLVDDSALKAEFVKAQEERAKFEAQQKAAASAAGAGAEANVKKEWGWKDNVPPDKLLSLVNGMIVINLASLYDEISAMKDKDYEAQYNDAKNSFAQWVKRITDDENFANNMIESKDKTAALKILEMRRDGKKLPVVKSPQAQSAAPSQNTQASPVQSVPQQSSLDATQSSSQGGQQSPSQPSSQSPSSQSPSSQSQLPDAQQTGQQQADPRQIDNATPSDDLQAKISQAQIQTLTLNAAEPESHQQSPATRDRRTSVIDSLVTGNPQEFFRLENGMEIKSVRELLDYLPKMDDSLFNNHVGKDYNHFADWIRGVFHEDALADKVSRAKTKGAMSAAVSG